LDPVELLDILGNENRRRILQLLSFRPFYFNEIAKRLDVGPKAVIDHLEMLERAGIIECYHDQTRRKYFRIARKTILEVAVSPHSYGVRAYRSEDTSAVMPLEAPDLQVLQIELLSLEERRQALRKLMDEIESKDMEVKRLAASAVRNYATDQMEAEILMALLSGSVGSETLAERLEIPKIIVEESLKSLEQRGMVHREGEQWSI
ncbi:MAG TPA: ArsR family transcriptional regulator, partial [Methanotrichaceae archaeon]|nr:ArsR family transcriptional regulator [Methanotrichaceae archaeon]